MTLEFLKTTYFYAHSIYANMRQSICKKNIVRDSRYFQYSRLPSAQNEEWERTKTANENAFYSFKLKTGLNSPAYSTCLLRQRTNLGETDTAIRLIQFRIRIKRNLFDLQNAFVYKRRDMIFVFGRFVHSVYRLQEIDQHTKLTDERAKRVTEMLTIN